MASVISISLPPTGMACGLSRLVPRIVPPTVRMPDNDELSSAVHAILHQPAKAIAETDHLHAITAQDRFADAAEWRHSGRDYHHRTSTTG